MRIIVHLEDPTDLALAMTSVKASIRDGHDSCAYGFANRYSTFVYRNKTGWTVRVQKDPKP